MRVLYSKKIQTILIEYAHSHHVAYPMTIENNFNAVVEYVDKRLSELEAKVDKLGGA